MGRKKEVVDVENTNVEIKKETVSKASEDSVATSKLKSELEKEKQANEDLKKQMEQMQQMMMQLQQTVLASQTVNKQVAPSNNAKVQLMSCAWGKLGLNDVNNSTIIEFEDTYAVETISYNVLQQLLTIENKNKFFKTGLVCFVGDSEKYYDEEGIPKPYILTKENIIKIYQQPYDKVINDLDKVINKDDRVFTVIFWQTVRMLAKNEIQDSTVLSMINTVLNQYFKCRNIESAKGQVNLAKDINFIK